MKKRMILLLVAAGIFLLSACGTARYESNDYHFTMRFPDEMTVFVPGQIDENDPALTEFDISAEDLKTYMADGGVFYAVGHENDIYREITVNVVETDYSAEVWQLKEEDTATLEEYVDEIIETFNVNGVEVLQKGQFRQGKAYCVFVNVASGAVDGIDAIYMATIYNGLQYSVLYQVNAEVTEDMENEAHKIFDSFYINETLSHPDEEPKDTAKLQAILVVVMLLIGVTVVVLVIGIFAGNRRHKEADQQPYVPQFEDITKTKKDKKQ